MYLRWLAALATAIVVGCGGSPALFGATPTTPTTPVPRFQRANDARRLAREPTQHCQGEAGRVVWRLETGNADVVYRATPMLSISGEIQLR